MKKKLVITLVVILICIKAFFLASIYADYNLKSHSVYYAKHTPHKKGVEPVLMMLIENLGSIYQPDIEGIEYSLDGKPTILLFDENHNQIGIYTIGYGLPSDRYLLYDWQSSYDVSFDQNFKISEITEIKTNKNLMIKKKNNKQFKQELYHQLKPLIDAQPEPWINLQWLFDQRYHDQFN